MNSYQQYLLDKRRGKLIATLAVIAAYAAGAMFGFSYALGDHADQCSENILILNGDTYHCTLMEQSHD